MTDSPGDEKATLELLGHRLNQLEQTAEHIHGDALHEYVQDWVGGVRKILIERHRNG